MEITKEDLAKQLDGMSYRSDIDEEFLEAAKENKLVIVTGASDDLIEFEGAFEDEGGCYGGGTFYIGINGILTKPDQDDYNDDESGEDKFYADFKAYLNAKKGGRAIVAEWCKDDKYSWTYVTGIPHASFDVIEYGEGYCRGIVFSLDDL